MPEKTKDMDERLTNEIREAAIKVHNVLAKDGSIQTSDVVAYVLIFLLGLQSQDPEMCNAIIDTVRANETAEEEM